MAVPTPIPFNGCQGDVGEQDNHKRPVPVIKAVNGESRPAMEQAATGVHGIGFQRQGRNHPSNQHRKPSRVHRMGSLPQ